ncbi:hypothetical protein B9Z55_018805 [Caenorhabditis nigoni]|uniref:C6 domain-containing protein n=1 Tax=Caenorhabditis nigoni TaxID=1611254 RepID=A0A2G5TFT9_9PELO|nr:hypothetical protein B9Z55_018805 [Caenorhabditis nigoni]
MSYFPSDCVMICPKFLLAIFLISELFHFGDVCLATSPGGSPTVPSSTVVPPTSSSTAIPTSSSTAVPARQCPIPPLGTGDNNDPQQMIDVTYSGLTYTPIAGTQDTTASMSVSCTAIDGYVAYMSFPPNRQPQENGQGADAPQTVTITATCSSVDEVWYYNTILPDGNLYTEAITSITCTQSITEGPGAG